MDELTRKSSESCVCLVLAPLRFIVLKFSSLAEVRPLSSAAECNPQVICGSFPSIVGGRKEKKTPEKRQGTNPTVTSPPHAPLNSFLKHSKLPNPLGCPILLASVRVQDWQDNLCLPPLHFVAPTWIVSFSAFSLRNTALYCARAILVGEHLLFDALARGSLTDELQHIAQRPVS